jgi:predicted metal-dependent hydrolase
MEVRPKKFTFNLSRYWFNNDRFKTFYWNANSIIFEHSEYVYCKTLNQLKNKINDPDLLEEIDTVFKQESWHSLNHREFNNQIKKYYDIIPVEKKAKQLTFFTNFLKGERKLSYTICFELFVINIIKPLFKKNFYNTDEEVVKFWKWHSLEEIEHNQTGPKIYNYFGYSKIKNKLHFIVFGYFYIKYLIWSILYFYKQDFLRGKENDFKFCK